MEANVWSEPLTAGSVIRDAQTFDTIVRDATGKPVAGVRCLVNTDARTGWFGEMRIDDNAGGIKQNARALVLMVREALRQAADLGITHVRTEAPQRLVAFASCMTNMQGRQLDADGARNDFAGELAGIRTWTLDTSDADGNLAQL